MAELEILKEFLEFPLWTTKPVFDKFRTLEGADFRERNESGKERFLFINGKRENKVVLVAHADTYFDEFYGYEQKKHIIVEKDGYFVGRTLKGGQSALGADDRAGCAILWALRDSGHSLLITDGEEHGQQGSKWLMNNNPDIAECINKHQFMIQFDRRNANDFKCYDVGTPGFRMFIILNTNYSEPDKSSHTDICTLCKDICGVNFSIGYNKEHSVEEKINYTDWHNTLNMTRNLISGSLQKFPLI